MMILRYIESLLVRQINWLRVLNRETGFISQGSTAAGPPPSHSSGCDSWRSRSCAAGICMLHSCIIQGVPSSQTWQRRLHVNTCHILRQTLFQAGENQNQWPIDSRRTWQSMAPFGWAVQSCAPSFGSSTVVSLPDAANFFFLLAPQEGGMWHNVTMDVDGCGWISSWYGRISEIVSANISNHHWFEELLCSGLRLCSEQLEGHHRSSEKSASPNTYIQFNHTFFNWGTVMNSVDLMEVLLAWTALSERGTSNARVRLMFVRADEGRMDMLKRLPRRPCRKHPSCLFGLGLLLESAEIFLILGVAEICGGALHHCCHQCKSQLSHCTRYKGKRNKQLNSIRS
jgi:hypothetical protein